MTEAPMLSLGDVAEALGVTPLVVLVQCSLHGLPCADGLVEPAYVDILRSAGVASASRPTIGAEGEDEDDGDIDTEHAAPRDPRARRIWVLQHVLSRLLRTGKIWPARTEPRTVARGLQDVGLGVAAVSVLERSGLVTGSPKRGDEHRVGLTGGRRQEAERIIATGTTEDPVLKNWIEGS
jgi:hypothetical protein